MKTRALYSALFVSLSLAFTACTPRDGKVVDDQTRLRINQKKGGRGQGQTQGGELKLGAYSMGAYLVEKQIEALELVQLVSGITNPAKTPYTASAKTESEEGFALTLEAASVKGQYSTAVATWNSKIAKKFEIKASVLKTDKVLQGLTVEGASLFSSVDKDQAKGVFVNDSTTSYKLSLQPSQSSPAQAVITVTSNGGFVLKNGGAGAPTKSQYTMNLSMTVDKASLDTNEVKIVSSTATIEYKYKTTVKAENLSVKLDAGCNLATGNFVLDSDKNKLPISYDGSNVKVGNRWTQNLASCGTRPTVDLGRLLVY